MIWLKRQKTSTKRCLLLTYEVWQSEREQKRGNDMDGSYGHRE